MRRGRNDRGLRPGEPRGSNAAENTAGDHVRRARARASGRNRAKTMPKQFIALIGERSTFQETVLRVAGPTFEPPIVITNFDYRFLVKEQLAEIGVEATIVNEPTRRDSGPAVAVAAALAAQRDPEAMVAVFASDHVITKRPSFWPSAPRRPRRRNRASSSRSASGRPSPRPATATSGPGEAIDDGAFKVEAFVEKPEREIAERYVAAGYLWNSGNFFFRADVDGRANCRRSSRRCRRGARGDRPGAAGSRLPRARRRGLRQIAEEIDRLCRDGAHAKAPPSCPPTSAGRTSATGTRSGSSASATRAAIRSTARASRSIPTTSTSARPAC